MNKRLCEDLTLPFDSVNFHATDYVMQAIPITKSLLENMSPVLWNTDDVYRFSVKLEVSLYGFFSILSHDRILKENPSQSSKFCMMRGATALPKTCTRAIDFMWVCCVDTVARLH
jgi:hypothetical protein